MFPPEILYKKVLAALKDTSASRLMNLRVRVYIYIYIPVYTYIYIYMSIYIYIYIYIYIICSYEPWLASSY